jgi:hypothetical protein
MPGDWSKKVNAGEPVNIAAEAQNAWTDAAMAFRRNKRQYGSGGLVAAPHEGLILIKNESGAAVQKCGVLGISGVLINDSQNLAEFLNNWTLTGTAPDNPGHLGKFAITLEPIPAGAIGRAFVFGTCPVQISINDPSDRWADIVDGDTTQLTSGSTGGVQILYAGEADDDGLSWAIVRFEFGLNTYLCPKNSGTGSGS